MKPCDFFMFPKVKSGLHGTRLETVGAVKQIATDVTNQLSENYLKDFFAQWKTRMERSGAV